MQYFFRFFSDFFLDSFLDIFFILRIFSCRFDTSGSMIARSVPEIHCTRGLCDAEDEEEELGIIVVG